MALSVSYGNYVFPSPVPYPGISEEPRYYQGQYDHSKLKVTLVGSLTGAGLTALKVQKDRLIQALSTGFQTLTIDTGVYSYAQPLSINFEDSPLFSYLPYTIEFSCYELSGNSTFFGLSDVTDSWSFDEQENRIVNATHTVSARAEKSSAASPLTFARNFVNSRLTGFFNCSTFLTGTSGFFTSKTETVNQLTNTYSVTENYSYSVGREEYDKSGVIVRANAQISWDGDLSVRVGGSILGGVTGLGGSPVTTGFFTISDAKRFALNAVERNKTSFDSGVYGSVFNNPSSFNYTFSDDKNEITFSFDFTDPTNTKGRGFLNEYTVGVSATKDSNIVGVNLQGSIKYTDPFLFFQTGAPETGYRWRMVESGFSGINPYEIAQIAYSDFFSGITGYDNSTELSPDPKNYSIDKDPFNSEIRYSYDFDNSIDFTSGFLTDAKFNVKQVYPITKMIPAATIGGGWILQTGFTTLGAVTVSVDGNVTGNMTGAFNYASGYVDTLIQTFGFTGLYSDTVITKYTVETGNKRISIDKEAIFHVRDAGSNVVPIS